MEPGVFRLVHHTHSTPTELLDDAVVRDGSPDHWRKYYVGERGKSMKAMELRISQSGSPISAGLVFGGRSTARPGLKLCLRIVTGRLKRSQFRQCLPMPRMRAVSARTDVGGIRFRDADHRSQSRDCKGLLSGEEFWPKRRLKTAETLGQQSGRLPI